MELILMTAAIIFLAILLWSCRTHSHLPPRPRRPLPIVGNLFDMKEDSRAQFKAWRKQCGDIFSFFIMGKLIVVLNGFDVIKEALVRQADAFSDRIPAFYDEATGIHEKGVAYASGDNWKEQRSVTLTILRKFGMGKNILAEKIQEEVSAFVNYLANKKGEPIDIHIITNISVSNVICSIIIGHRFEYDDKEFQDLIVCLTSTVLVHKNVSLINFIPWLKYLPGDLFHAKKIIRNVQANFKMFENFVFEKRSENVNSDDAADSFIHAYNIERNRKLEAGEHTFMDDENLHKIVLDLFYGGTETTSATIYWFVLYMLNFPDIQEKIYSEIKETVGTDRPPNMLDRKKLPNLHASILETQRLANIVPLSLMHKCSQDTTLRDYTIPKGAFVVPNLDSVLHDKIIWGEDVMSFRPERFFDVNGKLQNREELIPFSLGKRICPGQALAEMELFLFLSNLIQRFQFVPKDEMPPDCNNYIFGVICAPFNYDVRLLPRK